MLVTLKPEEGIELTPPGMDISNLADQSEGVTT